MYKTGELILYGSTGVCRITDIVKRRLTGDSAMGLYYVMKPLYQEVVISAPVNTDKVFMRPIVTRGEAERLIRTIPSVRAKAFHGVGFRQLAEHYESAIKTYDCGDLIQMLVSIRMKKRLLEQQRRKFGAVDERFMKRAEDLLSGELAAALDKPRDEVADYIVERVDEGVKQSCDGSTE